MYREGIAGEVEFFDTLQLTLRFAFSVTVVFPEARRLV